MIITCPNCQTRYQVANDTLGAVGRKVLCAHCQSAWQALPEPEPRGVPEDSNDLLFDEDAERELDAEFAAEEKEAVSWDFNQDEAIDAEAMVEPSPTTQPWRNAVDPAAEKKRQRAFFRRQSRMGRQLPLARVRRTVRWVSVVALLLVLTAVVVFRTSLVRQFPELAGVYAAVGLGVNVVGLEFSDVVTLNSQHTGAEVLSVTARIHSVSNQLVRVPQVVVTLLDAHGAALYEWSVAPDSSDLQPGEVLDFSTELPQPPAGASEVRLTFAGSRGQIPAAVSPSTPSSEAKP
ncbi:MAG TPA: DUF3426 domain-containing protein [Devosiaceae bacterium]|jgi:predicted Zn finger-like uncharacterized protein